MTETPQQEPVRKDRRRRLFRRFAKSRDGAAAVEFALVSIPFFALLFAIIETALMFFIGQILDNAVTEVARKIRTGQAHQSGMSATQMETEICSAMIDIGSCGERLYLDVRTYDSFGDVNLDSPINGDGEIGDVEFDIGISSQIVVVRGFYAWPAFFRFLSTNGTTLASGERLLGAVVAFRNEPFPW